MREINDEAQDQIRRILELGAQWIGLQRTSGVILSILYIHECTDREQLSIRRMSELTGLSASTISTICSQLEAFGIIVGQSGKSNQTRGRRKTVFSLRIGIHDLLHLGIKNYMNHVRRILGDIETIKNDSGFNDLDSHLTMDRVANEINQFLDENPSE
ncbi:MAG: hypothetical protein ACXACG_00320 [Candidatus Thorarchaeota archaeon]|jgi:DNA-binding transcriptional regulator GbsR (MarR family)